MAVAATTPAYAPRVRMDPRPDGIGELRGATRLALDATTRVVDVVEAMHRVIGGGPLLLGRPFLEPTRALSAPVYASVRSAVRAVGVCVDAALARLAPALGMAPGFEHDTVLAVLNGILGDHLVTSDNPLAIRMQLRREGYPLDLDRSSLRAAYPNATEKVLVLVHGSCRHDRLSGGGRIPSPRSRTSSASLRSTSCTTRDSTSRRTAASSLRCSNAL